ncbi:MAG: RagB/SusD family nutrient uptake outer membrane protein [Chitinophagaceae bacterium]|nr:RagB/SusD family nutrient uptake outer membrane protein [Chitinophagaceae bacterium]
MKPIYKFFIFGIALSVSAASCKKFLNQEPQYLLTPEGAITDEKSAEAVLNGAYSSIGKDEWTVRYSSGFSSMLGVVNASASAFNFNMTATGDNQFLWQIFYKTVNGANAALSAIEPLSEDVFKTQGRKQEMLAEARCIRAFAHFYTLLYFARWWDPADSKYGIIFKDQLSSLSNVYQARLTVGDSYKRILEDLDFAIANAPAWKSGIRMSKQLAQALKAKLLLYRGKQEDQAEALSLITDVIDKATSLGLVLEPSLTSLYNNSWDSKELLFCRYREKTDDVVLAYNYTYGYNYATLGIEALGKSFLEGDARYLEAWGDVKSPITNNNTFKWAPKKLCRKGRQVGGDNDKYTTYFLRLTELYFLQAELLEKTGKPLATALEPINVIRRRSHLVDTTITDRNEFYPLLFKELFTEIHIENEADWMASLRFIDVNTGQPFIYTFRNNLQLEQNKFIYPLPTSEMKYNSKVDQNPGYESLVY